MKNNTRIFAVAFATLTMMLSLAIAVFAAPMPMSPPVPAGLLDPTKIPKYVNQLVIPPVYVPTNVTDGNGKVIRQDYVINMSYYRQTILPPGTPLVGSLDGKTL